MFTLEDNGFMDFICDIMNASEGTLAHQVKNDWVLFAVEKNIDKLYESAE